MKFLIVGLISVFSLSAFSATPQDCLKEKRSLDRRYCLDKHLESIKEMHSAEKKTWANGLPAADKEAKTSSVEDAIAAKKEMLSMMQSEIALEEKHLDTLKAVPATAVAATVAPKKKKKKGGFRIKL